MSEVDCPKCTGVMHEVAYESVTVLRCDVCAGLWCTPQALIGMKQEWLAEAVLDTGDPRVGKAHDRIDDIDCPLGHGALLKETDEVQSHIWFERCATCGGVYLDAGELTDLRYRTLMDRLRALLKGERPREG